MPDDPKPSGGVRAAALARPLLAGVLTTAALTPAASAQVFETFLTLAGVEGEATDKQHGKAIEILSYSLGFAATPPQVIRGSAKPACEPFELTKRLDRASPKLMEHALTGTPIASGRLSMVMVDPKLSQEVLRIDLQNVTVTATSLVVPPGGGETLETISLKPAI